MRDRLLVAIYVALLALPAIAAVLHVPDRALAGSVEPPPRPHVTFDAIVGEQMQREATAWVEAELGLRNTEVIVDNTLLYHLFHETRFQAQVEVGRGGVLFQRDDISFLNWPERQLPPAEVVNAFADRLVRLQHRLAARGIALVPVVVPSKTSVWADAVPAQWRIDYAAPRPADRLYDLLRAALASHGISFVDAHAMLVGSPIDRELLWGRDARHWSRYGACLVLAEIAERAGRLTGKPDPLPCTYRLEPVRWSNDDLDLYRLLNALWVPRSVRSAPIDVYPPLAGPPRTRMRIIASSFGHQLHRVAIDSGRYSEAVLDYYHQSLAYAEGSAGGLADVYVVELFEPYFWPGPDYFVNKALDELEAQLR